jgi:2-polyprenyl-6-methoxyphenol hydroxylase-like FAD-dependent oxidoreductase
VPRMRQGRVAMVGDAAFIPRPHTAASTSKAVANARALGTALDVTGRTLMLHCENGSRCNSSWGTASYFRARRSGTVLNLASEP